MLQIVHTVLRARCSYKLLHFTSRVHLRSEFEGEKEVHIAYFMSTVHASSQAVFPAATDLNKDSGLRLYLNLYVLLCLYRCIALYAVHAITSSDR